MPADMLGLLAHLKPATLDWVGTSMGGLIGLAVTAHAQSVGVQVRKLVLNDVGPVIQWSSLQRIGTYLGRAVSFDNLQQAADAMVGDFEQFRAAHAGAVAGVVTSHGQDPAGRQGGAALRPMR